MKAPTARERQNQRVMECVDALREHCTNARAIAALLELCREVSAGSVDHEAVGDAGRLIQAELDLVEDGVRRLQEALR